MDEWLSFVRPTTSRSSCSSAASHCRRERRGRTWRTRASGSPRRAFARMPALANTTGRNAMKLINSIGPNPQVVRTFAAEKGIKLETEAVDIMKGENRKEPYLKKNPAGGSPCLQLDNGTYLSEITAI